MNYPGDMILGCGDSRMVIRAGDADAARLLARLPELIPAMVPTPDAAGRLAHLRVRCADDLPETRRLSERDGCGFHLDAGGELVFRVRPREYDVSHLVRLWCYILCGAVYSAIAHGEKLFMLHGGMIVRPDGEAAAWFGHSGIGKSTLASRLAATGIPAPADDALLLAPRGGGFVVRPLPTWSRAVAMNGGGVPDIPELPLKKLLLLDRDPAATGVREIDRLTFLSRLFGAISKHSLFMMRISPPELSRPVGRRLFAAAERLGGVFPPHCLFAALNDAGAVDILTS